MFFLNIHVFFEMEPTVRWATTTYIHMYHVTVYPYIVLDTNFCGLVIAFQEP